MTVLQDQPPVKTFRSSQANRRATQAGDRSPQAGQAQQESHDPWPAADEDQSSDQGNTFTVTADDWLKA